MIVDPTTDATADRLRALKVYWDSEAPAADCAVTVRASPAGSRRAAIHGASHAGRMLRARTAPAQTAAYALSL